MAPLFHMQVDARGTQRESLDMVVVVVVVSMSLLCHKQLLRAERAESPHLAPCVNLYKAHFASLCVL
jgi:hypothetical protein